MLNGRSGQDVSDAIGPIIDSGKFDVLALTDSLANWGEVRCRA